MDSQYVNKVREWVELDNKIIRTNDQIKTHLEDISECKEKRKVIEDDIVEYIQKNKYEKLTLNIRDGVIKFGKKTQSQPLNLKLVKTLLDKYALEKNIDTNDIYDYFMNNIDKKTTYFIKREFGDQ